MSNEAVFSAEQDAPFTEAAFVGGFRSLRPILQAENTECGLACVAMIANFYGFDIDLVSMRHRFPVSSQGQNLEDLVDIAGSIGISCRALRIEIEELGELALPCILHWDINHFVVLAERRGRYFTIVDPACGQRKISLDELGRHFSGVALELSPSSDFRRAKLRKTLAMSDLWTNILGFKSSLAQILLLSILFQICLIIAPLFIQIVVDTVFQRSQSGLLIPIAIGFGLIVIMQTGINLLRSYAILHLSSRLSVQMASNLFHHLLRLPLNYFIKRHLGDIVSRFESLNQIRQMMTTGIVSVWLDGLMALITLSVLFYYSLLLTAIVLFVVLLYTLLRIALFHKMKVLHQERLIAGANEISHFMESMRAIQTLKIFQKENDRQGQWLNKLTNVVNKDVKISQWDSGFAAANSILFGLENIIVLSVAILFVQDSKLSLGMLFAFMSFKGSFITSINSLITQTINFKMLGIHLERISDIVFTDKEEHLIPPPLEESSPANSNLSPFQVRGAIEVVGLGFCYEGHKEFVFRNLSFRIEVGDAVAITGPSGCGKSTLIKCLMGLLQPTEGKILIDGAPLNSICSYRKSIAGVMQDDQLISGSIKDNITFFSSSIDWERIYQCSSAASIHGDILKMPMKYDTLVGDLGGGLSGGQKQRIILARALYRQPRILFMDEATSHLDVESESLVTRQINELSITRVLVAHRPETVRSAGKQINMADFF